MDSWQLWLNSPKEHKFRRGGKWEGDKAQMTVITAPNIQKFNIRFTDERQVTYMRTSESHVLCGSDCLVLLFFKKRSCQLRGINSVLQTLNIKTIFQIFVQKQSHTILYEWHICFKWNTLFSIFAYLFIITSPHSAWVEFCTLVRVCVCYLKCNHKP